MKGKLAIDGGKPVCENYIAYGRQSIDQNDKNAVLKVLESDFLTTGPEISRFEQALADYVGAKYAVAYANGTAALHGACFAADVKAQDEVITSPLSFAASANCALYLGARPIFADIDEKTLNIDPNAIEKLISKKTKAIIPVHYTGRAADIDSIQALISNREITIIEDAAHALGTTYHDKKVGSISDMTEFSFHPVKTITTGEGGAITTNSERLYKQLKLFVSHGITRDAERLQDNRGPWYYEQQALGFNYRMTDMQAALGISQLSRIEEFISRRKALVALYDNAFVDEPGLTLQKSLPKSDAATHLYVLLLNLDELKVSRDQIFNALRAENIGVNVHYIPIYLHPYYQALGYQKGLCPVAESIYERLITIPLHPSMTDQDALHVIEGVKKVIRYYRL